MIDPGKPSAGLCRQMALDLANIGTVLNPLPLNIVVDSVVGSHELPTWVALSLTAGAKKVYWNVAMMVVGLIILLALATMGRKLGVHSQLAGASGILLRGNPG